MSPLRWVLRLGRSGRGRLRVAVLLGALASAAAVGLSATAAWLIVRASQQPPVLHLMVAIVAVRAFGLGRGVLRYGERLAGHDASLRILGDLRVATVEALEPAVPLRRRSARAAIGSGDLLARFVDDTDGLQDLWVRVVLPYASALIVGAATIGLIAALVPGAAVVLAVSLIMTAIGAPLVAARRARGASTRLAPLRAAYRTDVLDVMQGATELAVYGALTERLDRLATLDREMTAAEARSARGAGAGAALAALAGGGAVWAALWFGAEAVAAGTLSPVNLAVVVLVPLAVHEIAALLVPAGQLLPALSAAAARLRELFAQPPAVVEPAEPVAAPVGALGVRVVGLHAGWDDDGPQVIRGLDLELPAGSSLLITGPSGCGKSTFAAVLLRLLDPTAGRVELIAPTRAVGLTDLASDDVRRLVGWCAQDAYLFDSTIEANVRLARPDAEPSAIAEALAQAGLTEWIDGLPKGLHTMVGEHGRRLSGGQRQRVALARVLLADRRVVVFDEPTEHLDEPTARLLAHDLLAATAGRTVIVVTHRPDLFTADRVVALRDGRLVDVAGPVPPRSPASA